MRKKPVLFLIPLPAALVLLPLLGLKNESAAGKPAQVEPRTERLRRPVALVADQGLLFAANRPLSGTLTRSAGPLPRRSKLQAGVSPGRG